LVAFCAIAALEAGAALLDECKVERQGSPAERPATRGRRYGKKVARWGRRSAMRITGLHRVTTRRRYLTRKESTDLEACRAARPGDEKRLVQR
jgi:hypothetical protein